MIDTVPSHAKHQPENAIILPKWTGDPTDLNLVQFIQFLEYVATIGFNGTCKLLKSYEGDYIPAEFAKRENALREKFEGRLVEEREETQTQCWWSQFHPRDQESARSRWYWSQRIGRGQDVVGSDPKTRPEAV